jgi:hypothetical protein
MNPLPLTCALAALGLLLAPAPALQDAGRAPDKAPPSRAERLKKDIQGMWKLVRLESSTLKGQRRTEAGYLLATDEFLSFEAHIGWQDTQGYNDALAFFTGMHRFTLTNEGEILMTSLIGTSVEQGTGRPLFEPPGRTRGYQIDILDNTLTLTRRSDSQKFTFERYGAESGLDFYGRPKKKKTPESGAEAGG